MHFVILLWNNYVASLVSVEIKRPSTQMEAHLIMHELDQARVVAVACAVHTFSNIKKEKKRN